MHSQRDLHLHATNDLTQHVEGKSSTTVLHGNYVHQTNGRLTIKADKAVHLVSGQSRISLTSSDIIIEADEIAIGAGGGAGASPDAIKNAMAAANAAADQAIHKSPEKPQIAKPADIVKIKTDSKNEDNNVENALKEAMQKESIPDSWYNDLHWIMMQESGGKVGVKCADPNSTARGLFQLNKLNYKLNPNGEASFGNAVEECQGGIRYIKSRYHTAAAAKQFWEKHQWY